MEFEMRAKGEWRGRKEGRSEEGPSLSLPLSVSKGDLFLSGRMMRTTRTDEDGGGVGVTAAVAVRRNVSKHEFRDDVIILHDERGRRRRPESRRLSSSSLIRLTGDESASGRRRC